MMLFLMFPRENPMRTTLTLDDELLAQAKEYTGIKEKSALVNEALKSLVQREAARRLARLGGTMPGLKAPPRRRFDPR
jgi:Arc/MetJ family transcription regulator